MRTLSFYPICFKCVKSVEEPRSLCVAKDSKLPTKGPLGSLPFLSPSTVHFVLILPVHGFDVVDLTFRHVDLTLYMGYLPDVAAQTVALYVVACNV